MQLSPVAQVQILGQGIALPAPGIDDTSASPNSGRAVKIEKGLDDVAGGLLNHKMAIDAQRLGHGQGRRLGINVSPAGLDTTYVGLREQGNCFL